jgi:hypothetical protein
VVRSQAISVGPYHISAFMGWPYLTSVRGHQGERQVRGADPCVVVCVFKVIFGCPRLPDDDGDVCWGEDDGDTGGNGDED